MKCSADGEQEFYNDDERDIGYEPEAMLIESEEYIRFPLPKGKSGISLVQFFLSYLF